MKNEGELSHKASAYGIEVLSLGIERIALPEDTTQAVFQRMIDERSKVASKLESEGNTIKATKIAKANATKDETLAKAEAEAKAIRAKAEAEAAKYYEIFAKNEHLAIFLRKLESLQEDSLRRDEEQAAHRHGAQQQDRTVRHPGHWPRGQEGDRAPGRAAGRGPRQARAGAGGAARLRSHRR